MSYHTSDTQAVCRGCGRVLDGKPYHLGGRAYVPHDDPACTAPRVEARRNYYGGYACSQWCDRRASLYHEQSMPGHGMWQTRLLPETERRIEANWSSP